MSKFRKALVAGLFAGLAAVAQAIATSGFDRINWLVVAGAVLVTGYGVYRTPNKPKPC